MRRQRTETDREKDRERMGRYRDSAGTTCWWKNPPRMPETTTLAEAEQTLERHEADLPVLLDARSHALNMGDKKAYNSLKNRVFNKREEIKLWQRRVQEKRRKDAGAPYDQSVIV